MANTNKATTLKGTCSVCFGDFILTSGERPSRHGFNIVGTTWGHGHHGAWHTGPCMGWQFPHFGVSCEGTKAALSLARDQLSSTEVARANLDNNPELSWSHNPRRGAWDRSPAKTIWFTVKLGDDETWIDNAGATVAPYCGARVPSYTNLLASKKSELDNTVARIEHAIATYTKAIATWKPAKAKTVAKQGPTTHAPSNWKGRVGIQAPKCKQFGLHHPAPFRAAAEGKEPTCKACRKALGLAVK